jgi:hypothetical protein
MRRRLSWSKIVWELLGIDGRPEMCGESKNTLHYDAELYILRTLFSAESVRVDSYNLGLDQRESISESQAFADITGVPSGNNYSARQLLCNAGNFSISADPQGGYLVTLPTQSWQPIGGSWGLMTSVHLVTPTTGANANLLVASYPLGSGANMLEGKVLNVNMTISIRPPA